MKNNYQEDIIQKFTLSLKSLTNRKRVLEAQKYLLDLYPYEIQIENIFLEKTKHKDIFDVYVLKNERNQKKNIVGAIFILLSVILLFSISCFVIRHFVLINERVSIIKNEKIFQEQEKKRIQSEKELKLKNLEKEYKEKKIHKYEKVYPFIERIYTVMYAESFIENISIEKNNFSVEVKTKDALQILENFEKNNAFYSIKMNRTTVRNGNETVTYTGTFSAKEKQVDEKISLEEKILFYENELELIKNRCEKQSEKQISEYIRTIREILRKNGCAEQYIQLYGNEKFVEVEFFVHSNSRSILNFIKDVQEGEDNLFDIKHINLRTNDLIDKIQTTICFDSGIELQRVKNEFVEFEEQKILISDLEKVFYKVPEQSINYSKPQNQTVNTVAIRQEIKNQRLKQLTYVGLTKSAEKTYVLAKDVEMESIYKFIVSNEELKDGFCIKTENGYKAMLREELYEVRK